MVRRHRPQRLHGTSARRPLGERIVRELSRALSRSSRVYVYRAPNFLNARRCAAEPSWRRSSSRRSRAAPRWRHRSPARLGSLGERGLGGLARACVCFPSTNMIARVCSSSTDTPRMWEIRASVDFGTSARPLQAEAAHASFAQNSTGAVRLRVARAPRREREMGSVSRTLGDRERSRSDTVRPREGRPSSLCRRRAPLSLLLRVSAFPTVPERV